MKNILNINNSTAVFHQERIPDTQILSSFCGKFIPIISAPYYNENQEIKRDQICVQYSSQIKIYGIYNKENDETINKLILLNTYEIFDKIEYSEKFNSLLNNKSINSIILSLSSYKISIIEYNIQYDAFDTLALYSIDQFLLGGKLNVEKCFKIVSSLTYNWIALLYDENKLSILKKKKDDKKNEIINDNENVSQGGFASENHSYSDTINGDKYFYPTIYLNDLNNKYNIYKIINIYIPKKNFELFYFKNSFEENKKNKKEFDIIQIYILYIESKIENIEHNNINNSSENNNDINNNGIVNNNNINEKNQINISSFMRDKISLGLLSYNVKTNEYIDFKILFNGVDENAFDFTILEKKNNISDNLAIIFSAYNLQLINLKLKTSENYIMNNYYNLTFSKLYPDLNKYKINNHFINNNYNLDLRGSGFLVIDNNSFIFSDSKGKIFFTAFNDNNDVNFDQIEIVNEYNCLCSPYNHILMPYGFIFFLSSPFSDGIVLTCDKNENNYRITDRIINYSPIINFNLVNDINNYDLKLAFTSGYAENSNLSFAHEQFIYYEFPKNLQDIYDISYMKSINYFENNYTKYILSKLKSNKLEIFQNINKDIINISNKIEYNKDLNIIDFGLINNDIIILLFDKEIKFYDNNFNLLDTINNLNNNLININKAKVGENNILICNSDKRYFLLGLYNDKIDCNNKNNNDIVEIMINQNLYVRYKELTKYLYDKNNVNELIKVNMSSKLYLNKFNFLIIYRNNITIEIYDITHFLEYKDNMILEDNNKKNNIKLLLKSNYINYAPPILLSDTLNKKILYRSGSNPTIDFSKNIYNLFNFNEDEISNNLNNSNSELNLKSSLSFSSDFPDFVYFDSLGNVCILAITFKTRLLIYSLYISEMTKDNKEILGIGFKKKIIEKLVNVDYKEFFRINLNNLFIPFNNIDTKKGILFNLENNQKIIYEKNGEICFLKINNKNNKSNFNNFCDFNSEEINNGFVISEGEIFKCCYLDKNYSLSNYSLLIRTNKINRFPVLLTYDPEFNNTNTHYSFYSYIMIEKEMISPNRFQYYMTLRREEKQPLCEIKFELDEIVSVCNIIELPIIIGNNNSKKYIAIGINIIEDKQGEDNYINGKIKFYYKYNGKLEFVKEKSGFKGIITMIQSLYNFIFVGEGSRINIYQFYPDEEFKMNILYYMENKNLGICNRIANKLLLTGDIVDSFNLMYIRHLLNNNSIDIIVAAKDNNHIKITTCNLWTVKELHFCILFDEDNNGYIYFLDNNSPRICDFHINKNINEIRADTYKNKNQNEYYSYYYSSLNGSIGFINHIENDIYEKLNYLCEFIYYHFPFNSGVNPKLFYSLNYENDSNNNFQKPKGRFIDFKILDIFLKLSDKMQDIICRNVLGIDDKNIIIKNIYDLID